MISLFISRENTSCDYACEGQLPGRGGIEKVLYHKLEDEYISYFHILLCTFLKYLLRIYGFSNRIFDYLHVAICTTCMHTCLLGYQVRNKHKIVTVGPTEELDFHRGVLCVISVMSDWTYLKTHSNSTESVRSGPGTEFC